MDKLIKKVEKDIKKTVSKDTKKLMKEDKVLDKKVDSCKGMKKKKKK